MKAAAGLALAGLICVVASSPARAQDDAAHTVLSPEDVRLYGDIFRAEQTGQSAKSTAAIAKLADKSLMGYVLETRYLAPHYRTQFGELKTWLENYGDHVGADKIYKLATKRAPKKTRVPAPTPMRWRGAPGESQAFADVPLQTALAQRTYVRLRALERRGMPEDAHELLKKVFADSTLPQGDADQLAAYVAASYLAEAKNEEALALAEETASHGSASSPQCHWTAGLASYRLGQYENAAQHFEAVSQMRDTAPLMSSGGAFWAARSWMRLGRPEQVVALYARAASQKDNFYGLLAARLIGRDDGPAFSEPTLDSVSFASLMLDKPAHRAVALWQIGRTEDASAEMARAFSEITPDLDSAYAALAHHLELPSLELHAAETAAAHDVKLSSLYPVPSYQPKGGYTLDQAVVLAFARQESRFENAALSPAGARGIMQIMPATAAIVAHDRSLAGANRKKLDDPTYSLTLGEKYMRDILDRQGNNLFQLAAAYNAGEGNLAKWMAVHDNKDDPLLFIESIPAPETRDYVKRVMMNMWMYRKRLGEPAIGLDDAASGVWPVYKQAGTVAAR